MNKRRMLALIMACAMTFSVLTSCVDSSQSSVEYAEYDVEAAIAPYLDKLPEIPEEEKDYMINMGYFNCDHMLGAIVGQEAGIYKALGLNVTVTKSGQSMNAVIAGDMDCAYVGFSGVIRNYNKNAPVVTLVGSHLGGARYFLVRDEIETLEDIKRLTVTETSMESTEWLRFSSELGMNPDYTCYDGVSMGNEDAMLAIKADQLDGAFV